jgi:putative Holliday junction resolvase
MWVTPDRQQLSRSGPLPIVPQLPTRFLLGFDYGRKRIGVALGQSVTRTASSLETLVARDGQPDWHAVERIVHAWQPAALIVGLPLALDGSEQDTTSEARRFARRLEGRFHLPVYLVDERLTSREAEYTIKTQPDKDSSDIDQIAAQIILQTWFDNTDSP